MNLNKFVPKIYKKSVLDIDYKKLKEQGIKYLIFDLDNTLAVIDENKVSVKIRELIKKLKKDFKIIVLSNNFKYRIKPICDMIDVTFISFSMKPFSKGLKKVLKMYCLEKKDACIIGDQLVTDILGGNKFGIMTILVDPLSEKDLRITKINRFIERKIIKKINNKNVLERGCYYD